MKDGYVVFPYVCSLEREMEEFPGILNGTVGRLIELSKFTARDVDYILKHSAPADQTRVMFGYTNRWGDRDSSTVATDLTAFPTHAAQAPEASGEPKSTGTSATTPAASPGAGASSLWKDSGGDDKVYTMADTKPEFPEGIFGIFKHLARYQRYPETNLKKKPKGKVMVAFVVEKDGTVGEVEAVEKVHPLLDEQAVWLVKTLPRFTAPAKIAGRPVRFKMTLPITFKPPKK